MNIENINKLIDHLRTNFDKVGFNMISYAPDHVPDYSGHNCQTACCIAGHIALLGDKPDDTYHFPYGRNYLDITNNEAMALFTPAEYDNKGTDVDWSLITPSVAIRVLETFRDTGKISFRDAIAAEGGGL